MLQTVDTGLLCLAGYELSAGAEAVDQLRNLAQPLRGCRVLHLIRDPVCGMKVDPRRDVALEHQGRTVYFCSVECRQIFRQDPGRFAATEGASKR